METYCAGSLIEFKGIGNVFGRGPSGSSTSELSAGPEPEWNNSGLKMEGPLNELLRGVEPQGDIRLPSSALLLLIIRLRKAVVECSWATSDWNGAVSTLSRSAIRLKPPLVLGGRDDLRLLFEGVEDTGDRPSRTMALQESLMGVDWSVRMIIEAGSCRRILGYIFLAAAVGGSAGRC